MSDRLCEPVHSLASHPLGSLAREIIAAALDSIDPRSAVARNVQRLPGDTIRIGDVLMPLPSGRRVRVAGAGKAAVAMVRGLADALGEDGIAGAVITKGEPSITSIGGVQILPGDHPLPSERSVRSTERVVESLAECDAQDLVLCPISGGASALLCAPMTGVPLADLRMTVELCLRSGMSIERLNAVRSGLDQIKRGGLRFAAGDARDNVAALVLSDVPGDRIDVVESGPTVGTPVNQTAARMALDGHDLWQRVPESVREALSRQRPAPPEPRRRPFDVLVAANSTARRGAATAAADAGLHAAIDGAPLRGDAREVGQAIARRIAGGDPMLPAGGCLVFGGETTVTHDGSAVGGRNLELALAAVRGLAAADIDALLVTLATDGEDGSSNAAGAVVTRASLARAEALGLDVDTALAEHRSDAFFAALGDRLVTGPTGTNVADIAFVLRP